MQPRPTSSPRTELRSLVRGRVLHDERDDQAGDEEADHFHQDVGRGVGGVETVPVPIGKVRRDRGEETGHADEEDTTAEGGETGLGPAGRRSEGLPEN